jgi:hypothetical protein
MISPVISFWNTASSLSNCFSTSAATTNKTDKVPNGQFRDASSHTHDRTRTRATIPRLSVPLPSRSMALKTTTHHEAVISRRRTTTHHQKIFREERGRTLGLLLQRAQSQD